MTTDVRLTATTEDGQVVYILANQKGELKLEEPIVPPPFDGNLDGNLNVQGTIFSSGNLDTGPYISGASGVRLSNQGVVNVIRAGSGQQAALAIKDEDNDQHLTAFNDGTIIADGNITCQKVLINRASGVPDSTSVFNAQKNGTDRVSFTLGGNAAFAGDVTAVDARLTGSISINGGKAGFTSEGHLYCTTTSGDLVILESVSSGVGTWVAYVPPSRKDQVQEKLDGWQENDKTPSTNPIQD